jgi:hypothetical protein
MHNVTSNGEGTGGCSSKVAPSTCCQYEKVSLCCNPKGGSWGKGKVLISLIIILAAIGVGAASFMRGNSTQAVAANPAPCAPNQCGAACNTDCAK